MHLTFATRPLFRAALFAIVCSASPALESGAQANSGALDLLLPNGARATALGTAFVAEQGSEAIWWNPAGISRLTRPEFALDHFETVFIKGDAAAFILPVRAVGKIGLSLRLLNTGEGAALDSAGNEIGTLLNRTILVGATFAAPLGPNVDFGVTFRMHQGRSDCAGICTNDQSTTPAVDVGVQFRTAVASPIRYGLALRNVGPPVQVRDSPQADNLPTRMHAGVSYDPRLASMPADLQLRTTAELVATPRLQLPELRLGAQLGYVTPNSSLLVRAGYIRQSEAGRSDATGPTIGLGLAQGRVQVDITRVFERFSTELGVEPTYISIRVGL